MGLNLELLDVLFEVLLATSLLQSHRVLSHAQLLQVFLDVVDGLFIVCQLFFFIPIVVTKVTSVKHIVLQRVVVIRKGLQVMGTDEPLFVVLVRHGILNVLEIIVGRQV